MRRLEEHKEQVHLRHQHGRREHRQYLLEAQTAHGAPWR